MSDALVAIVGTYRASPEDRVWIALPSLPIAESVAVEAWAVLSDGSVMPIGARFEEPPRALTGMAWARDLETLAQRWVDDLPALPLMPEGTTINGVPIARFDSITVIVGSVGLGNEAWGPYTICDEQIEAGVDLIPELAEPDSSRGLSYLIPGARIDCRVTWGRSSFIEMDPVATVLLEPAEELHRG